MTDLRKKTLNSISWNTLNHVFQQSIGFISTLILARLLNPDDFGILAMVSVFLAFIAIFKDLGLGPSIIQDQNITKEQLSSIFWFNFFFSILLSLIIIGCAPFISYFYNNDSIKLIMITLSINFPVSGLALIPDALLRKHFQFKKITFIQNTAVLTGSAIGIIMAFMGFGVWALVWSQIIGTIINTVLLWIFSPVRVIFTVRYTKIKKQLNFGINLQLGSFFNYLTRNMDDLLIGKFIGASTLGVYRMAYRMMLWPLNNISKVIGQVMFPTLSTIKNDKERIKHVFLKSTSSIALFTFPMVLGTWVIASSIINSLLGEKWVEVIPIFRVLCILGLSQSILTNTGWIFLSQGRTDIRLKMQMVFSILFIASFVIGINWGAIGVAICYTIVNLLITPIQFQIAGKLINMTFGDIIREISGIFCCAIIMAGCIWIVRYLIPVELSDQVYLAILIPMGILLYILLIHIFRIKAYHDVRLILLEQIKTLYLRIFKISTSKH